jgi:putative transposase
MVNLKRVRRLMKEMGLEAIYQKPNLSRPNRMHAIYPYLLKGVVANRPNQVWATDITYIRLAAGFLYLVAILDWFSRYVVSWEVSVTMDAGFCVGA